MPTSDFKERYGFTVNTKVKHDKWVNRLWNSQALVHGILRADDPQWAWWTFKNLNEHKEGACFEMNHRGARAHVLGRLLWCSVHGRATPDRPQIKWPEDTWATRMLTCTWTPQEWQCPKVFPPVLCLTLSIWSFVIDMSDHLHSSLVGTCRILKAERRTYAMPSYIINLFHILSEILKDKYFISIRAENLLTNFKVSYTGNTLIWISLIMPNV